MKQNPVQATPSVREILNAVGKQLKRLEPARRPTSEVVAAAKAVSGLVNGYSNIMRLSMEYAKLSGRKPDVQHLGIPLLPERGA